MFIWVFVSGKLVILFLFWYFRQQLVDGIASQWMIKAGLMLGVNKAMNFFAVYLHFLIYSSFLQLYILEIHQIRKYYI